MIEAIHHVVALTVAIACLSLVFWIAIKLGIALDWILSHPENEED